MKIKGKKITGLNEDVLVLPRSDEDIIFKARSLQSFEEFEKLCPLPEPPEKLYPGGVRKKDTTNPKYLEQLEKINKLRIAYMVIKSLEATEGLEWEKVDINNPDTWLHYEKELLESVSYIEYQRIVGLCVKVNSLSDDMLEEAKVNFYRSQEERKE